MADGFLYLGDVLIGRSYTMKRSYFTMKAKTSGVIGLPIAQNNNGGGTSADPAAMFYRKNGGSWIQYQTGTTTTSPSVTVAVGDVIEVKGNAAPNYMTGYLSFTVDDTATYDLYGNILSLFYDDSFQYFNEYPSFSTNYYNVFSFKRKRIVSAKDLIFPSASLVMANTAVGAYQDMFSGCTYMTDAPELPSTQLGEKCYSKMFIGCTSLVNGPSNLPATSGAERCYTNMFQGCTSLVKAPHIAAETVGERSFYEMFSGCTSLSATQETLYPSALTSYCYYGMYRGCTSLRTAPKLPAKSLVSNCYGYMFNGCSKLNYIDAAFKTTPSSQFTSNWVDGVSGSGTFVKGEEALWDVRGVNGIPTSWIVEGGMDITESTGTTFMGLSIAPGDLYYGSGGYQIMPAWDTYNSYGSSYGNTNGSTYFRLLDLGKRFSSLGSNYNYAQSQSIDNGGTLVSYNSKSWRMPIHGEISLLVNGFKTYGDMNASLKIKREGALVLTPDGVFDHAFAAWVMINSTQNGLIIFRDNAVITSVAGTFSNNGGISYSGESACNQINMATSQPWRISTTEFNHLMEMGCAFIPFKGIANYNGSSYTWMTSTPSILWAATVVSSYGTTANAGLWFGANENGYLVKDNYIISEIGNISLEESTSSSEASSKFGLAYAQCRLVSDKLTGAANFVGVQVYPGMNMAYITLTGDGWDASNLTNNPPSIYLLSSGQYIKQDVTAWTLVNSTTLRADVSGGGSYTFTLTNGNPTAVSYSA